MRYIQIMLTVIAIILALQLVKPFITPPEVRARDIEYVRVLGTVDVNLASVNGIIAFYPLEVRPVR